MPSFPIPTSGKARVLGELSGSFGGAKMRRGFKGRARRKRETKPQNSKWIPQTFFHDHDFSFGGGAGLGIALGPPQYAVTINPVAMADLAFAEQTGGSGAQAEAAYLLKLDDSKVKVKRFQGQLVCAPEIWDEAAADVFDDMENAPFWVHYAWFKLQLDATGAQPPATDFDLCDTTGEGIRALQKRDILGWGQFRIQRTLSGLNLSATNKNMNRMAQVIPSRTIPFPRLPKEGLLLDRNTSLVLWTCAKRQSAGASPSDLGRFYANNADISGASSLGNKLVFWQNFRTLVSFDD